VTEASLLDFPCRFPIKALGKEADGIDQVVLEIVRRHAPETDRSQLSSRSSRNGRYISVTVTIRASSQAQLDDIYRELSAHGQVIMAL